MEQSTLNPGFLDFYIVRPLANIDHVDRRKIMGHPQLSFQQDCRSFWQKEPVTMHHIVLPCILVTDACRGIWMTPGLLASDIHIQILIILPMTISD